MVSKAKAAATAAGTRPLGEMIDELYALNLKKAEIEASKKPVQERIDAINEEIIKALDEQKVDGSRGKLATVSIQESVVTDTPNWDELWPWISKTKNFQLVVKNINQAAFRELLALETAKKRSIPGTTPKTVRKLSVRKVA